MSTRNMQGVVSPIIPASIAGGSNYSGVYTLDQLNRLNAVYPNHIGNSLRFRSSASAYLNRTPSVAGNQNKWTWSAWVKRGSRLGSTYDPVFAAGSSGSAYSALWFNNDTFVVYSYSGATSYYLVTTQVFRDPSAWYHIVVAVDTTQTTSTNRIKLYVNGVQVTSFSTATYPSQNYSDYFDSTAPHYFGQFTPALGSTYFDGYMAEVNFIDGQALTPSAFGKFYYETGVWCPSKYSGTYGTNGFYLKFTDTTSTTTLCYDYSGNSNNWTPNNISLTAGSTYDSMLDSPTNYDNGGTGVGNYAVANPLSVVGSTLTDGNLSVSVAGGTNTAVGSIAISSGKWYWENTVVSATTNDVMIGIVNAANAASARTYSSSGTWYYYGANGNKYVNGSPSSYGSSYTAGDVVGIAFDSDNGTLTFYKNGVSQGVAASSGLTGISIFPVWGNGTSGGAQVYAPNFGQRPFAYTPPTGYKALNTQNLSAPSIVNGAAYMAATLYTGNGATNLTVANANNSVSFQPGFVWIKKRGPGTANHCLNNEVMGVGTGVSLYTASTSAAGAYDIYGYLSALTSTGFTTQKGTDPTYPNDLVNESGSTYVAWQWKAGGTAVTNTAGSITSSVSANTTSGFAVVTYSGNSTVGATVGHGLGVAPSMIIFKSRNTAGTSWDTYHVALGATKYLLLDSTAAAGTSSWLNNTAPSSSVITLNNFGDSNASGSTYVAYCFAAIPGYSAFGSYTGNGSTDGPFIYLGFRPRFIMYKRTDSAADWVILDSTRDAYNQQSLYLLPDSSSAELDYTSSYPMDFVSNGWKIRQGSTGGNASGGTYIYAAFAENPFNYSLAR